MVFGGKIFATRFFYFSNMKANNKTQYNFRMTEEEIGQLRKMAQESGRTVSAFIRAKLFGGEKATINAVEFLKEYKAQIHELQKIGNNINQLAHYANICMNSGQLSQSVVEEMNEKMGDLIRCERAIESLERKIIR